MLRPGIAESFHNNFGGDRTGWLGKWEWNIAKGTISINRKACQTTVHGCNLNCTRSFKEWETPLWSDFTVNGLIAAENNTSTLQHVPFCFYLCWFTCKQQKPTCSTAPRWLANRCWAKTGKRCFFFKCICFSQIKERDPTLQKKNDPTSRESKGDKRESDGIQAELEQTGVCSRLMCVLAEGSNQQFLTVHMKCNMTRVCVLFFQLHKATIQ